MSDLPKTFDEAVRWVIDQIKPQNRDEIYFRLRTKHEDPETIAGMSHHTFGMFVRNSLLLWLKESEDLRQAIWDTLPAEKQEFYRKWWVGKGDHEGRTMHADDASHTLITAAVKKIAGG